MKRRHADYDIRGIERNPPDSTFGFGLVFSERALEFLKADDPGTFSALTAAASRARRALDWIKAIATVVNSSTPITPSRTELRLGLGRLASLWDRSLFSMICQFSLSSNLRGCNYE